MRRYELTYDSANSDSYSKPITALVLEPDRLNQGTGAMLFTHGWGGNRFQHEDKMREAVDAFDLVCIAVEFRQSGYAFDPLRGAGWDRPYDASFYQVFDVLNGLRRLLDLYPGVDRGRLFHYGGSQGGHIALLSAVYAPATFAWVYAASPLTHLAAEMQEWTGRTFARHELAARDVAHLAAHLRCPVSLEHGTADPTVPCDPHTRRLARHLEGLGKQVQAVFHEGADHGLAPVTNRLETFRATAPQALRALRRDGEDDFARGNTVSLDCGGRTLLIDWSRPIHDAGLCRWE